jgi:hypothetical protein
MHRRASSNSEAYRVSKPSVYLLSEISRYESDVTLMAFKGTDEIVAPLEPSAELYLSRDSANSKRTLCAQAQRRLPVQPFSGPTH